MTEIKIFPIFNQSAPGVWDDFLHIRACAMRANYNINLTPTEISVYRREYSYNWAHYGVNFAYGAYDGTEIVGFSYGYCNRNLVKLSCLYVLPEYQRSGIGRRLLRRVETDMGVIGRRMDLTSLSRAERFYQKNNYTPIFTGSNNYQKPIKVPHCTCVPVFGKSVRIFRECRQLSANFDTDAFMGNNFPTFVYLDENGRIVSSLIGTYDRNKILLLNSANGTDSWAVRCVSTDYNNFIAHSLLCAEQKLR